MNHKNSSNAKCRQCGMINWATDENCRRCHQFLGRSKSPTGTDVSPSRFYLYLIIFLAALAIPVLVGMANPEIGAVLAVIFILAATVINLYANVSLIVDMFRVSIGWGLAGIFLAPVSTLLFIVNYWERAKNKIIMSLAAIAYCMIVFLGMHQLVKAKIAQNKTNPPPTPATSYLDQTPTPKPDFLQPREDLLKKKPSNK
jgi:ribosomal protein L40E